MEATVVEDTDLVIETDHGSNLTVNGWNVTSNKSYNFRYIEQNNSTMLSSFRLMYKTSSGLTSI